MIVQANTQLDADMSLAQEIAETLHASYPGHLWYVTIQGGAVIVKNLWISQLFGMVIHLKNINHDAKVRKAKIIRAGGELLERAKMARGMFEGQAPKSVEGIDPKYRRAAA